MKRLLWTAAVLAFALPASAQESPDEEEPAPSTARTPLAGDPITLELFGRRIEVPARDRSSTLAVNLGSSVFSPRIGDQVVVPFAALYWDRLGPERRIHAVVSVLVNEIEGAERLPGPFEAVLRVESSTIPFPSAEIIDGRTFEPSEIEWGTVSGWPGLGLKIPVAPWQTDNALQVQLFYRLGWLYSRRTHDTGDAYELPPDTLVHGPVLRVKVDALRRNLLELPHAGFALGAQASFSRRDRWSDHGIRGVWFLEKDRTRDVALVSGYAVAALGLPFLSERHRLVLQAHAGAPLHGTPDRFSAFRLGGGPPTTETNDLFRSPYPGAAFDQFSARWYLIGGVEYRYEVLPFVYFHARGTLGLGRIATLDRSGAGARVNEPKANSPRARIVFATRSGESVSFGVTSGAPFESVVYIEYAYDLGASRGGREGHSVLLLWSKAM